MPLSPSATRELLAQLGHQPRRFLGQNFLVDGNIVRKSLELAGIEPGDAVVEIGPGLGTLTEALLESEAEVWAVEKDRLLHAHLTETLQPRFPHHLHLQEGDAVEQPLAGFSSPAGTPRREFKIVANLPYAIATPWIDAVLGGPLPVQMVLMLQQEAAQRYTASPGSKSFGAISVFLQAAYDVAPGHKVAPGCFFPRPEVESKLLNLMRKPDPFVFPAEVKGIIRSCFQQRRKQIGPLLRSRLEFQHGWRELLGSASLSEQTRPEAIPVEWWVRFSAMFSA
jgi:16S rRNA (adenine1518-N6/adenine1519-N6)-dimethyltransferase